jgi:mannose-6-phosphate isomerase-like protein (cupin superfamily)
MSTATSHKPTLRVLSHAAATSGYPAPFVRLHGRCESAFEPVPGRELWACTATLEPGAALEWDASHGDEVVFIRSGEVCVNGDAAADDAAIVIESGAPATLVAVSSVRLVHIGTADATAFGGGLLGMPYPVGHGVHVIHHEEVPVFRHDHGDGTFADSRYYADGVCRTCRLALLRNSSEFPSISPSHFHSVDEIMHVLRGQLRFGGVVVSAGESAFIPAGMRYAFRADGPWEFINYRRSLSQYIGHPGDEPILETWNKTKPIRTGVESVAESRGLR